MALAIGPATVAKSQDSLLASGEWRWQQVLSAPDVNRTEVEWLRDSSGNGTARRLIHIVAELSKPEASQLLPSYGYIDGSSNSPLRRAQLDSFSRRPATGVAGVIHVAYLAARTRQAIMMANGPTSVYRGGFAASAPSLTAQLIASEHDGAPLFANTRNGRNHFALSLDFAPADTLLAIVTTPGISYDDAYRRISTHPFDALVEHNSQDFYPVALSREALSLNLMHAASNAPLDQLYRYAFPSGLLHLTDARENEARYRMLFDTLHAHEPEIVASVARRIGPYVPPGTSVTRHLSVFFSNGADGWGAQDVTAVDIEYYKDDLRRFFDVLVHETYHAAQTAVRPVPPPLRTMSARDSALTAAAEQLLVEGTATYVAPALGRSAASADSMASLGSVLLDSIVTAPVDRSARYAETFGALISRGVAGAGPFYWLGAAMSRVIVETLGPDALAATLRRGGVDFVETYERAERRGGTRHNLITPTTTAAFRRLTTTH